MSRTIINLGLNRLVSHGGRGLLVTTAALIVAAGFVDTASAQKAKGGDSKGSLVIPTIKQLKNPPSRGAYGPAASIVQTKAHPTLGKGYVVVTDQTDKTALKALQRLADFHKGSVVSVESLGTLHQSPDEFKNLQKELKELKPRYVAIAPKPESYRENMHLAMLKLLAGLDDDPSLDVFPGYLVASDPESLSKLVERSIDFKPLSEKELRPASIGAIEDTDQRRYRSYQKAKVMQRMFSEEGIESPAIIVTTRKSHLAQDDFPDLESDGGNIAMMPKSERTTFEKFSPDAVEALKDNNLLVHVWTWNHSENLWRTHLSL